MGRGPGEDGKSCFPGAPALPPIPAIISSTYNEQGDEPLQLETNEIYRGTTEATSEAFPTSNERQSIAEPLKSQTEIHPQKYTETSLSTISPISIEPDSDERLFKPPKDEAQVKEDMATRTHMNSRELNAREEVLNSEGIPTQQAGPQTINEAPQLAHVSLKHIKSKPTSTKRDALMAEARAMIQELLGAVDQDKHRHARDSDSTLAFSRNPLRAFGDSDALTPEKFVASGGLRSIIVAIKKYSYSGDVVDFGCKALSAFCLLDNSSIQEMMKLSAAPTVISAAEEQLHASHATSSVSALKMLRNLTQTPEQRKEIFENRGLEVTIQSIREKPDDARCSSHAALVLSNLAFGNTQIKEAVGAKGGIEAIANAMKAHGDYQPMQARGALALRNLFYSSEYTQEVAGPAGAAEALVRAVAGYPEDREVAHQACMALANMSNVNESNRFHIAKADGPNVIISLMRRHSKSATVNDDGITILRNICVGNEPAAAEVGALGGVQAIITAMSFFPKDGKILEKACAAIRHLCFVEENRNRVGHALGLEAIVESLKENLRSDTAVENALLAIGNASFGSSDNKLSVGRCGGIQAIVKAVEGLRLTASIQEHGCRVLRNLVDGQDFNRRLAVEAGAVNTAVFAMMGYPENASVQEQALALLLNLSMSDASIDRLVDADAGRLAEKAMNSHARHRGVTLQAGQLIDRINGHTFDESPTNGRRHGRENENARFGFKSLLGRGRR